MAHVLVIDDDELIVKLMVHALSRRGHQVAFALDGDAGVRELDRAHFDAIVCDIVMPEKEGVEIIQQVRRARPDLGIVAVSGGIGGRAGMDVLDLVEKLGADVTIKKSFQMSALCDAVDQAIATRADAVKAARA
jgi:two-component system, chemotaxis family, chemotaxis protein CheY